jgi:uncharacterized protein YigE (DUF2233 family)
MKHMRAFIVIFWVVLALAACTQSEAREPVCENITYKTASYSVCRVDTSTHDVRLYLNDVTGIPYGNFSKLTNALKTDNQNLIFAMNGGMYHQDRSPAGLYIEDNNQIQKINTNKGPGNFHLLPNGVFVVHENGVAVMQSAQYLLAKFPKVNYATQSGPMLVIDGKLHPKFNPASKSLNIRNGVGVRGSTVIFVISNERVNFHNFASLFKDYLKTPNALFLDGAVSKLYAPELGRNDNGAPMGPIIAVTAK